MQRNLKQVALVLGAAIVGGVVGLHRLPTANAEPPKLIFNNAAVSASQNDQTTAIAEMAQAAQNFWASLTPEQQAVAGFEFKSDERTNWHFIPKPRKGLPLREMKSEQKELAHALLSSGLSYQGYSRAVSIMSLDAILRELENDKTGKRDPEGYFVSIFGKPAAGETWGWRVEGHHLSLNFTIVDGKEIAATPAFYGNNPAKVLAGSREGLRTLGPEEDLGRQFVKSLNDDQKKKGVLAEAAPKDIYTSANRKAVLESHDGIAFGDLNPDQQTQLVSLVFMYASRHRAEVAAADMDKISKAGWGKVIFAWQGSAEPGQPHYYRIKGPSFLVEYDNTQNNANHIHTVWRDPANDFGDDVLAGHMQQDHLAK